MNQAPDQVPAQQSWPGFVVVEGPIGVGKTTLARRLADSFGSNLLLEGADEVFESSSTASKKNGDEPEAAELYEQIGRLKVELEWLKKKVAQDLE